MLIGVRYSDDYVLPRNRVTIDIDKTIKGIRYWDAYYKRVEYLDCQTLIWGYSNTKVPNYCSGSLQMILNSRRPYSFDNVQEVINAFGCSVLRLVHCNKKNMPILSATENKVVTNEFVCVVESTNNYVMVVFPDDTCKRMTHKEYTTWKKAKKAFTGNAERAKYNFSKEVYFI